MYVTSDIFDVKRIFSVLDASAIERGYVRPEMLACGIAVHGSRWPGYQAAAKFLVEAGKRCNLLEVMEYAGHARFRHGTRRMLTMESFERLLQGELPTRDELSGADNVTELSLTGYATPPGLEGELILIGGELDGSIRANSGFPPDEARNDAALSASASFVFPLGDRSIETAIDLFRLSVDMLGIEYGYYFVRDDVCFPLGYVSGYAIHLDRSPLVYEDAGEMEHWNAFAKDGRLWSGKWPLLRDLYQMNLLSERHTSVPVEGLGYLIEWISARSGRGQLTDIGDGRVIWALTDAEMFNVRPLLNRAGVLLSCRDRVYRDLPHGMANSADP